MNGTALDAVKRLFLLLLAMFLIPVFSDAQERIKDCKFRGVKLNGRVRVVKKGQVPTFNVKVVTGNKIASIYVKIVKSASDGEFGICGHWAFVEKEETFSIEFVEKNEDFTVCFVEENPGSM